MKQLILSLLFTFLLFNPLISFGQGKYALTQKNGIEISYDIETLELNSYLVICYIKNTNNKTATIDMDLKCTVEYEQGRKQDLPITNQVSYIIDSGDMETKQLTVRSSTRPMAFANIKKIYIWK